jgi:hypothetical protein
LYDTRRPRAEPKRPQSFTVSIDRLSEAAATYRGIVLSNGYLGNKIVLFISELAVFPSTFLTDKVASKHNLEPPLFTKKQQASKSVIHKYLRSRDSRQHPFRDCGYRDNPHQI